MTKNIFLGIVKNYTNCSKVLESNSPKKESCKIYRSGIKSSDQSLLLKNQSEQKLKDCVLIKKVSRVLHINKTNLVNLLKLLYRLVNCSVLKSKNYFFLPHYRKLKFN